MDITTAIFVVAIVLAVGFCVSKICQEKCVSSDKETYRKTLIGINGDPKQKANRINKLASAFSKAFPLTKKDSIEYRDALIRAGMNIGPETWHGITIMTTVIGIAVGMLSGLAFNPSAADSPIFTMVVSVGVGFAAGFGLPKVYLIRKTKKRRDNIEYDLPNALELMAISVQAGSTIERSFRQIASRSTGPLADEFAIVDREINLLNVDKAEALRHMSNRCQCQSVSVFCSAMIQAIKQGTSISRVLHGQALMARKAWFDKLEEKANKIPTKMTIPLVVFFVPCMFVLSAAPLFAQLVGFFVGGGGIL